MQGLANFAGYIVKITAAWSIVVAGLSFIAGPHLAPYQQLPTLVSDLSARVNFLTDDTNKNFDKYGRQIANLRDEIDELKVQPLIVEYDLQRSRILGGQCKIGELCLAEFRFRRTSQGRACAKPSAQYWVSNHFGDTRPAVEVRSNIVRADMEWIIVPVQFRLPQGVLPGAGFFFIRLEYTECPWSVPGGVAKESTPKLAFEIVG
jgi:hypothetical protein